MRNLAIWKSDSHQCSLEPSYKNAAAFSRLYDLIMEAVMIAQWENDSLSRSVFSMARVQFVVVAEYFKEFFPG